MILTGNEIIKQVSTGGITISPFTTDQITTNSYDICLGDTLIQYTDKVLDPKKNNKFIEIKIPEEGIILDKNEFYLGSSMEILGSDNFVPIIHGKSGIARLGLFVHVTADLIDIGSIGNITFQLFPTIPVKIYKGMKIGQVSFWVPKGKIVLYSGKYQRSKGPQVSKSHEDYIDGITP